MNQVPTSEQGKSTCSVLTAEMLLEQEFITLCLASTHCCSELCVTVTLAYRKLLFGAELVVHFVLLHLILRN
jgi:hypothetical protein